MNTTRPYGTEQTYGAEPLREADVSITLKGVVRGSDAMVTLRGRELGAVLQKCEVALSWLENPASLPVEDVGSGNGRSTNGQTPETPPPHEQYYCTFHKAPLRRYTKGGQVWYSHQLRDGSWCRGIEG